MQNAFKLSSKVVRYIFFPENPDTFYAITESVSIYQMIKHEQKKQLDKG